MFTEMEGTLEGIKSRLEDAEKWTSNLEDRVMESTQPERQKGKNKTKRIA